MVTADTLLADMSACLRQWQQNPARPLAVAFSGGIDSRFLCHVLQRGKIPFLALHARGPHVPEAESRYARAWAERTGIDMEEVDFNPLSDSRVARNDTQRCYFCKTALIAALRQHLALRCPQTGSDWLLCDGSNADDIKSYRPGLRALAEAGVRSPLAALSLTKADIRRLAAETALELPDQQARPCLLTRFAYNLVPTVAQLRQLAQAEAQLAALSGNNKTAALGDFRLRLTPAPLLQAQRLPEQLRPDVEQILRHCGFATCEIRTEEQISGLYDRPSP